MTNQRRRILIPRKHWTRIINRVFDEELREFRENQAAAVYLFLIDRADHSSTKAVAITRAELAAAIRMDERVVKNCLDELSAVGFIELQRTGISHSRINKDVWRVPAVEEVHTEPYTPVPRLIITEYIPAFHSAALLPVLLRHQHLSWNNWCWMGIAKLSKILNWSPNRVRDALGAMGTESGWKAKGTGLPRPVQMKTVTRSKKGKYYTNTVRHYQVLAVEYTLESDMRLRRVFIPEAFRDRFGIK
jgi:hypothetical protein